MRRYCLLIALAIASFSFAQKNVQASEPFAAKLINVRFKDASQIRFTPLMSGKDSENLKQNEIRFMHTGIQPAVLEDINQYGYWTRLYSGSAARMDSLRRNTERNLGKPIRDPNAVCLFHLYNAANGDKLIERLKALDAVERVSKVPLVQNPEAPDYTSSQLYLLDGPSGINAGEVWNIYNNHGAGIKVCDIEFNFNMNHMDLPPVTYLGGYSTIPDYFDHGTAVLGEIASKDDGNGSHGIATEVQLFFASTYSTVDYNFEEAIYQAMTALEAGDILLIEQHMAGPNYTGFGQEGFVPMEWYESFFDALQLAVGQGIIVVEAAGNGGENLDDPIYSMDNEGHYPFLSGNGSGAILVGAGAATSDVMRSRLWFSNYGQAVRIQGNGESILTTGYGDLYYDDGENGSYTGEFGGTSGASPIIVGAIALVQSTWEHETGTRLTSDQILEALILTGKPQTDGMNTSGQQIGPLPDVYDAVVYLLAQIGLEEAGKPLLEIYPNPSDGVFRIRADVKDVSGLTVTDINGKLVSIELLSNEAGIATLRLPDASNGVYFVRLFSGDELITEKIVLQRF